MVKHVVIKNCQECPYHEHVNDNGVWILECGVEGHELTRTDFEHSDDEFEIPEWCTLESIHAYTL
jgi:hypothetical protein